VVELVDAGAVVPGEVLPVGAEVAAVDVAEPHVVAPGA
jgi:hypothetical protein